MGVGFWIGVGFQNDAIFPALVSDFAGGLLRNGMTAGGLAAILMTLFLEITSPRRHRMESDFDLSALPNIRAFLEGFARRQGWDKGTADRLMAASEETLLALIPRDGEHSQPGGCSWSRTGRAKARSRTGRGDRRGKPAGQDRTARRRKSRGDAGGTGNITPSPEALRYFGAPPAVPRYRYRHPSGGRAPADGRRIVRRSAASAMRTGRHTAPPPLLLPSLLLT